MPDFSREYPVSLYITTDTACDSYSWTTDFFIDEAVAGPEGTVYKADQSQDTDQPQKTVFNEIEYQNVVSQLNSYRKSRNLEPLTYKELTKSEKTSFARRQKRICNSVTAAIFGSWNIRMEASPVPYSAKVRSSYPTTAYRPLI